MKILYSLFLLIHQLFYIGEGYDLLKSKLFVIKYIDRDISIDGILNCKEWISVDSIAGLNTPWDTVSFDSTIFKCFHSEQFLYFCFDVADKNIITCGFDGELTVAKEDRVELFFSATSAMEQYYCIEIDPLGRILDYSAVYYRKFDELWDLNQIKIATQFTNRGYIVEGCIPLVELERLGIKDSLNIGIFRADFCSDKIDDVVWHSWIEPESKTPDFHIPSSLGNCIIENP